MNIIVPNTLVELDHSSPYFNRAVYFVGGPVRGGGDWQRDMAGLLADLDPTGIIVVPNRWGKDHKLASAFLPGAQDVFPRQLNYERHYLDKAGYEQRPGCIVFYCPVQRAPRPVQDGPYGQDTYGELGEWRGRMMQNPDLRVVVGAQDGFPGLSQIQRNFNLALGREFPIYKTMGETAKAGVYMAHRIF